MKKLFNLRPLFVGAISLILSILVTANYMLNKTTFNLVLLILFYVAVALVCAYLVFLIFKGNYKTLKFVTICLVVLVSLIGLVGTTVSLTPHKTLSGTQTVTATIDGVKTYDKSVKLNLKDVSVNNEFLSGYTELVVFNYGVETNFSAGDKITATANFKTLTKNYDNLTYVVNHINYNATCSLTNVEVVSNGSTIKSLITLKIKENLNNNLNLDNAKIAYSVLFGEKENMSDIYTVFSYAGIAHILAVSGLHVGFLVAMLVAFLKVIKCNKHALNVVVFVILLFYAYLCGFTPSVVRAMVMSMVMLISKAYGKQYDALSSLSFGAVVILMFSPLSIFSVGFQLSFGCVLAIITLSKGITKFLNKIKCPKFISNSLAISLAVNLGVLTITAKHFNQISFISTLSNLVVLPVFSVCFSMLFVVSFVGLLIPFVNYLLVIPNIILHFIKLMANFFANISFLNLEIFRFSYVLVALSLFAVYFIGFALANKRVKAVVSSVVILIIASIAVVINIPTTFNCNSGYTSYTNSGGYVLLTQPNNNKTLIVNSVDSVSKINTKLTELKVNKVNNLVVNNYSVKCDEQIKSLIEKYNIDTLFIENTFKDVAYTNLSKFVFVRAFNGSINVGEISIETKYFNDENIGLQFNINNTLVLMLNDGVSKLQVNNLSYENVSYNYVVYNNVNLNFSETELKYNNLVNLKNFN